MRRAFKGSGYNRRSLFDIRLFIANFHLQAYIEVNQKEGEGNDDEGFQSNELLLYESDPEPELNADCFKTILNKTDRSGHDQRHSRTFHF